MAYSFQTPVDIANRALQLIGGARISTFGDNSRNASEIAACYDKLRQAELSRNVWRFAVRRTVLSPFSSSSTRIAPALYNASTIYPQGAIVVDAKGIWWQSLIPSNSGNTPGSYTAGQKAAWAPYFGPRSADPYDTTGATAYNAGQVVYEVPATGVPNFYSTLIENNSGDPSLAASWSSTTIYTIGQTVNYGGLYYKNLLAFNINNVPSASDPQWQSTITYGVGALVCGYDGREYQSLVVSNLGVNPVTDTTQSHWGPTGKMVPWTGAFADPFSSLTWVLHTGMTVDPRQFIYPIGAGPAEDAQSGNVFLLPANFLRIAPQSPKDGLVHWLGGPAFDPPNDWVMENDAFTSRSPTPIIFRFVADVQDVSTMDAMFCEGLAYRIALAVCEQLTQSPQKFTEVTQAYVRLMAEARIVNAIEEDSIETPEDAYITVRI